MLALLVAAALLPTSGCSFFVIQPPPEHPAPHESINCTTSSGAPPFDIILGVLELVSFGIVESIGSKTSMTSFQIIAAPLAGAQIGAGVWGFRKVRACNELMASHGPYPPRGYPRAYVPPPPSAIEPRSPSPEAPPPAQPTAAPLGTAAPSTPAPRVRQQIDSE